MMIKGSKIYKIRAVLKTNDILCINGDILLHAIRVKGLKVTIKSQKPATIGMGARRDLIEATKRKNGKGLGTLDLYRNPRQSVLIIKSNATGQLEKVLYEIYIEAECQAEIGINAPRDYLIIRKEKLRHHQKEFVKNSGF